MSTVTIYHNPSCGTSRNTLALIRNAGIEPGTAASIKGGLIVTATGLVFATAADRKVHVYDSATGTQLSELPLGGNTTGAPSMYELNGRQYLLVTSSPVPGAGGRGDLGVPTSSGPAGITAFALPKP